MKQTNQMKSDEYRLKAEEAAALAAASRLPQVRERHEAAASVWSRLSAMEAEAAADVSRRRPPEERLAG